MKCYYGKDCDDTQCAEHIKDKYQRKVLFHCIWDHWGKDGAKDRPPTMLTAKEYIKYKYLLGKLGIAATEEEKNRFSVNGWILLEYRRLLNVIQRRETEKRSALDAESSVKKEIKSFS